MIQYLIRRFVRDPENTGDQRVRQSYGTLGALTGMALNLLLSGVKILLGLLTGSVAVTADGVNNLSDAGGSLISLAAVRLAQRPMDNDHPFGHGRVEYLGALGVGVLIAVFGVELLKSGIESILHPTPVSFSWLTAALLLVGMLVKLWMSRFYRLLGQKTDNPTLLAAGKDSLSDVLATGAVLLSALVGHSTGWPVDGWVGAAVALLVLKAAWDVLKDTVNSLLGGKPDPETGRRIRDLLLGYDGILGIHDLVLHDYGPGRCMASVHAEVKSDCDLVATHEIIDRAEREIMEQLNVPICIHLDPIVTGDEKTETAKRQMQAYLSSLTPPLMLHDFRRVPGEKAINLIFDVVLPPSLTDKKPVLDGIQAHAKTLDPRYKCVVHFDTDYFSGTFLH